MIIPLEIKDQANTDFCLGCAISSIAEEYVGEVCDESYSYAAGKRYSGKPINARGLNVKDALMGAIEYGVLPKSKSPYSIATHSRDFLANWNNWKDLQKHVVYPFGSFSKVKNLDVALKDTTVLTGIFWQGLWNSDIIISEVQDSHKYEPHEVRIIGKEKDTYIIQNSRGVDVGHNGLWYMKDDALKYIHHLYILKPEPWKNLLDKYLKKLL